MGASQKWAVVAVILDGTLIHGTTASLHLGEWIGHRAVIEELERRFAAGEIDSADVADGDAPYYKGRSIAEVSDAIAGAPCIDDIHEGANNSRLAESMRCCAP
jgi:phosphoserine phosphatase